MTRNQENHMSDVDPGKTYLFFNIFIGGGIHDRKTDKENVRLRITQWTQPVIVFLSSGIK